MPFTRKISKYLSALLATTLPVSSIVITSCVDENEKYAEEVLNSWFHYRINKIDATNNFADSYELNMPVVFSSTKTYAKKMAEKCNAKLLTNFYNTKNKEGSHIYTLIPWKLLNKLGYKKENESKIKFEASIKTFLYHITGEPKQIVIDDFTLTVKDDNPSRHHEIKIGQEYFNLNGEMTKYKVEVELHNDSEGSDYEPPKTIATIDLDLKLNFENKK